jgi:peptidoglycan/xylan/chitin deacetylase (PgdA/CDA1 family)
MPTNDRSAADGTADSPLKSGQTRSSSEDTEYRKESGPALGEGKVSKKPPVEQDFGAFVSSMARSSPDRFKTPGHSSAKRPHRDPSRERLPSRSLPEREGRDVPGPTPRRQPERPGRSWRDSAAEPMAGTATGTGKDGTSSSGAGRLVRGGSPGREVPPHYVAMLLIGLVLLLLITVSLVNRDGDTALDREIMEQTPETLLGLSGPSPDTEVPAPLPPASGPQLIASPPDELRRGGDNQRGRPGAPEDRQSLPDSSALANGAIAPNELGYIPVLEYHVFTSDPAAEDQFTRPLDDFLADLQWLYEHNFYVIPLADFVRNDIKSPRGKHPVVLTFDDSTSSQFLFVRDGNGELVPDPTSAVGMMERFFAAHPDFGRGGFFAVLPYNCFSIPDHEDQADLCDQKLAWLNDHGYEVGNHTMTHANLGDLDDETFRSEIGGAIQWLDEHAPSHKGQMLVMPYGRYPDRDLHPEQREMLENGFEYEGRTYQIEAAFMVGADPSPSPSSTLWDPIYIPRIQAFDDELARWFPRMESGDVVLYTGDGNPDTISVPDPLPPLLESEFDPNLIAASGKTLTQYEIDALSRKIGTSRLRLAVPILALPRQKAEGARSVASLS